MARTKEIDVDRVLYKTRELISRFGLAKTTIADIARASQVAKSSLYYYFNSKEEIFRRVLEAEIEVYRCRIDEALTSLTDPLEKLRTYIHIRMASIKDFGTVYRTFAEEYVKFYSFIRKMREGYDKYETETLERLLSEGNSAGVLAVSDVRLTANTLVAAMKGLEYEWTTSMSHEQIKTSVEEMLSVLFYGIVKRRELK